jgi:hypothetical protein
MQDMRHHKKYTKRYWNQINTVSPVSQYQFQSQILCYSGISIDGFLSHEMC